MLNAHQKAAQGIALSAEDITELLKDPNSWISKLYQECILGKELIEKEIFIQILIATQEREIAEKAQTDATRQAQQDEAAKIERYYYSQQPVNVTLSSSEPKSTTLITNELSVNYVGEALTKALGPSIQVGNRTFKVPPIKANYVGGGILGTFDIMQQIAEANGQDVSELSPAEKIALAILSDRAQAKVIVMDNKVITYFTESQPETELDPNRPLAPPLAVIVTTNKEDISHDIGRNKTNAEVKEEISERIRNDRSYNRSYK